MINSKIHNSEKERLIFALIFNVLIFVLEVIGTVLSIKRHGVKVFEYYTENSNYIAMISSLIFVVFAINKLIFKSQIPRFVKVFRLISTLGLSITFVVVMFVFVPMFPNIAEFLVFKNSNLYEHFLCPIFSVLSFVFFESETKFQKRYVFFALIPTITYGVAIVILNILRVVRGPYLFLSIYEVEWFVCVLFLAGIFLIAMLFSWMLVKINNKLVRKF